MKKAKAKKTLKTDTYHHGDLKSTLIAAAIKLLKTQASDDLSLRELAREAGVSQAAPYRHFANKEELIAAIMKEGFDLQTRYMIESTEKHKDNPQEMFYQCGLSYFRMGLKHPQHFKLMFGSKVIPDECYPELQMSASGTFVTLRKTITHIQKLGVIGPGDPYHKSMNCWAVVHGFTTLYVEGRLEWLGVHSGNAENALRALLSQYLVGSKQPMDSSASQFKMFETKESQGYLELMENLK